MQNEAMKNVVENDAGQGVQKPTADQGTLVPKKRKPRMRKAKVRKGNPGTPTPGKTASQATQPGRTHEPEGLGMRALKKRIPNAPDHETGQGHFYFCVPANRCAQSQNAVT